MNESEINVLGVQALESLYEDLVPTSVFEEDTKVTEEYMAPMQPEDSFDNDLGQADSEEVQYKSKRSWKRKVCPVSAGRRSARIKYKCKFHDEK